MEPAVAVEGVGAGDNKFPPVGASYHLIVPTPVAVTGKAVANWQYVRFVVVGGAGIGLTTAEIVAIGDLQPLTVTLTL
jgi:hypothetical protein